MGSVSVVEKELTVEELDETSKQLGEHIDLMIWNVENENKQIVEMKESQDAVVKLLKSVSEVRQDYQQLRQELVEVQALQRELSGRLRAQLRVVHGKFSKLRQRLTGVTPPPQ